MNPINADPIEKEVEREIPDVYTADMMDRISLNSSDSSNDAASSTDDESISTEGNYYFSCD
jgi:hypothetical protein